MNDSVVQAIYAFDGFRLDAQRRLLSRANGEPIPLAPKAFDTLLYLVERPGQLIDKRELLDAIWPHVIVEENNLNQAISALRRVLGETAGEHRFIVTAPGHGYRFVASVATIANLSEPGRRTASTEDSTAYEPQAPTERTARATPWLRRHWQGAVLGIAAVGVAAALFGLRGPPSNSPLRVTPLSFEKGGQRTPIWSPDGKSVAFAARPSSSERYQVYVRELEAPVARPVTRTAKNPVLGQWTTSGRILFADDEPRQGLWSVSPVGAAPELIIDFQQRDVRGIDATIARDGSAFAVLRRDEDGTYGLWTSALMDGALKKYEPAPFEARQFVNNPFVRFSPDGKQLLLMWNPARGEEAWLMPFPPDKTRPPRRILESLPAVTGTPQFSWLPDNRHIVVSTSPDANTRRQLYFADTLTGEYRLIRSSPTAQVAPVVSPDGDKLVFSEIRGDLDIVALDLETAAVTDLVATGLVEQMPAWAASADSMVYVTNRSGAPEIWLTERGQLDRPLVTAGDFTTPTQWFLAPALSHDGTRVIYQRVEANGTASNLWMSAVAGGSPERLTRDGAREQTGSWSADGVWYVYTTLDLDGSVTLRKVKTTGQAEGETLLTGVEQVDLLPAWSPDGEWILLANGGMQLLSADGKTARKLGIENALCAFAQGKELIYCIREPREDARRPLVSIDFDGNTVDLIGSVGPEHAPVASLGPGLRLTLAPNSASAAYAIASPTSATLWLVEGLSALALP